MLLCEVATGDVYTDSGFDAYGIDETLEKKIKKYNTLKIFGRMRPNPIYNKTLSTGMSLISNPRLRIPLICTGLDSA
jgi:hypothetical protein